MGYCQRCLAGFAERRGELVSDLAGQETGSAGIKRDGVGRGSRLIRVLLAKPIPNRRFQICESVKTPVAKNNVHSGVLTKAQSIDQPWSADLPAMLTGASIAHAATLANPLFEASAPS